MNGLERLGHLLAEQQEAKLAARARDAGQREQFLRAYRSGVHQRSYRPITWLLAAATLFGAVVLTSWWWLTPHVLTAQRGAEGTPLVEREIVAATGGAEPVSFSDGSRVLLEQGAALRLTALTELGAGLELLAGDVQVSVVHRAKARWSLRAGPYLVRVTGTRFEAAWDQDLQQLSLQMWEGEVRVSGGELVSERRLSAGESLRLLAKPVAADLSRDTADGWDDPPALNAVPRSADDPGSVATETSAEAANERAAARVRKRPSEQPALNDWHELARQGSYPAAYALAERQGLGRLMASGSAIELLTLADAARFSKHSPEARTVLLALRDRFAGSDEASNAAFQLGRLSGDTHQAVHWFRVYLQEQPVGVLSREASGRLLELLSKLGDEAAARVQARHYLQHFPDGPHAAFAHSLARP